ncbi:hypothetical protein TSAR_005747 [Trichomalopsis sarcophagae]|uniref:Uncharacterized protein n=1 Tax=Trichomalopsis sarcophagae TaxID=543379 RepID=A0A232FEQ3_9HYME|nr:hypothetical protein TSAR_005747 [Trichomalopsis sarcophagae]
MPNCMPSSQIVWHIVAICPC